jgi:hypothetical protein
MTVIDHLVCAAPDLDRAVEDLATRFGVRAAYGGHHVGLGTHNALAALGRRTYLEIIAPDPSQPAPSLARPFQLDERFEVRIAGWAVACHDIEEAIAHARRMGYDPGDAIEMTRAGPSGTVLRWRLTLNALAGGPIPFLIDWGDTEHPAQSAPSGLVLDAFEIEHPEPESLSAALKALNAMVDVKPAEHTALVAHVRGACGVKELR